MMFSSLWETKIFHTELGKLIEKMQMQQQQQPKDATTAYYRTQYNTMDYFLKTKLFTVDGTFKKKSNLLTKLIKGGLKDWPCLKTL